MSLACFVSEAAPAPLLLVEEVNHRVFNEYAEAIASLSLAAAATTSEPARLALRSAAERLGAHADVHRALLPPAGDGAINLGDYLGEICASLAAASLADRGVRIALQTEEVCLAGDRCWRVGLIVAELLRNAIRHGLADGGSIHVQLSERLGHLRCLVRDTGRAPADPPSGRGRRVVQSLAREIGGSVEWSFTPLGCLARLQAPTTDLAAPR